MYLHLCISPSWHFHYHIAHAIISRSWVEWNIMERRYTGVTLFWKRGRRTICGSCRLHGTLVARTIAKIFELDACRVSDMILIKWPPHLEKDLP